MIKTTSSTRGFAACGEFAFTTPAKPLVGKIRTTILLSTGIAHISIWWNMFISQFGHSQLGGTQSFLNSVEHGHFYIFLILEHGHFYIFLIWWNTVSHFSIHSQCGTQPFLSLVEHGHFYIFLIWWNTVISQFGGTQSFSIWWNTVIFQFCGTQSFLYFPDSVEHMSWNSLILFGEVMRL